MIQEPTNQSNDKKGKSIKTFAYALAWFSFLASVGLAIYEVVKDKKPPIRDEYYK